MFIIADHSFQRFADLPIALQTKIWTLAATQWTEEILACPPIKVLNGVLLILHADDTTDPEMPALLHVNKLCRDICYDTMIRHQEETWLDVPRSLYGEGTDDGEDAEDEKQGGDEQVKAKEMGPLNLYIKGEFDDPGYGLLVLDLRLPSLVQRMEMEEVRQHEVNEYEAPESVQRLTERLKDKDFVWLPDLDAVQRMDHPPIEKGKEKERHPLVAMFEAQTNRANWAAVGERGYDEVLASNTHAPTFTGLPKAIRGKIWTLAALSWITEIPACRPVSVYNGVLFILKTNNMYPRKIPNLLHIDRQCRGICYDLAINHEPRLPQLMFRLAERDAREAYVWAPADLFIKWERDEPGVGLNVQDFSLPNLAFRVKRESKRIRQMVPCLDPDNIEHLNMMRQYNEFLWLPDLEEVKAKATVYQEKEEREEDADTNADRIEAINIDHYEDMNADEAGYKHGEKAQ